MTGIVCFLLVDRRGHLLMQEKDEHAPRGANDQFWAAPVDWTDDDIVVGEGRQIVFVDPEHLPGLDLWPSAAHFPPQFLASSAYTALRKG